ncbi:multidrug resistance protein A [Vibrio cholerae]|uniref:Multidrug resistance protein A n=2 Tax=Vibrio cholerae TaxID=666 RepID=A0A655QNK1_VIBCL|nr:multidrug resistance protein A [Vibrio cholerae]
MKETEAVLERLANRDSGALVVKLPREPGKRESRYHHLFCGEVDMAAFATSSDNEANASSQYAELEQEVAALREEVAELRALIERHLG